MFRRNRYKVTVTGWFGLYMNYGDKYHFYRIRVYILIFGQRTGWVFGLLGIAASGIIGSLITATVGAILMLWIASLFNKRNVD
jgi:uncharacterized membrane protein YeaQ/YmgE (transglycosylase-associated protein family)